MRDAVAAFPIRIALFAASLSALLMAAPASAQLATSRSGLSSTTETSSTSEKVFWSEMRAFGVCVINTRPRDAVLLLATRPGTAEEEPIFKGLMKKPLLCSGEEVTMNVSSWMVRGAIAEAAYRRAADRETPPAGAPRASAPGKTMSESADCYVAGHTRDVHALIFEITLGSKQEAEAVDKLFTEYQKCLPEGVNLRISPTQLRYAFAEAMYRVTPEAAARLK